jgi:hypothetical protein
LIKRLKYKQQINCLTRFRTPHLFSFAGNKRQLSYNQHLPKFLGKGAPIQMLPSKKISSIMVKRFLLVCLAFVIVMACTISNQVDSTYQSTLVALQIQQTRLANSQSTLTQANQDKVGQKTPIPTSTKSVDTPPVTVQADLQTPIPTDELSDGLPDERSLKSARILLFEDMSASGQVRYVMDALEQAHYFFLDVGSAKGWFKTQLLSSQEWDLIIAAAEAGRNFGGEYFDLIMERVESGAAAIIEYRDFESAPDGRSKSFLDRCGLEYQLDWFEPDLRVFFPLVPGHPVFNEPNAGMSSWRTGAPMWQGDVGDLLRIKTLAGQPQGDAMLLVGTNAGWKDDHGLLATCIDGRVILQTFPSHEVYYGDMIRLWQNYAYQTLKNRFAVATPPAPAPVAVVDPSATPSEGIPVPAESEYYTCGDIFRARLIRAPQYQTDLFEHHAYGTFAILRLELSNQSTSPVFIWDEDYTMEAQLNGKPVAYRPDVAATGYLYIDSGSNLYQDRIESGQTWRTSLAFDIDRESSQRVLVVRPGSEFNETVCEVRIPVSK